MKFSNEQIAQTNKELAKKNLRLASESKDEAGQYTTVMIDNETVKIWATNTPAEVLGTMVADITLENATFPLPSAQEFLEGGFNWFNFVCGDAVYLEDCDNIGADYATFWGYDSDYQPVIKFRGN